MPVQQNMCHSSVPRNTMSVTVGMQEDHSFVKLDLDVGNYIGVFFLMLFCFVLFFLIKG